MVVLMLGKSSTVRHPSQNTPSPPPQAHSPPPLPSDAIPTLVAPPTNVGQFRHLFIEVGCFVKVNEVMKIMREVLQEVRGHRTPTLARDTMWCLWYTLQCKHLPITTGGRDGPRLCLDQLNWWLFVLLYFSPSTIPSILLSSSLS